MDRAVSSSQLAAKICSTMPEWTGTSVSSGAVVAAVVPAVASVGSAASRLRKLEADPDFAKAILAIGRGGKKPRKDLAVWKDAKDYMGFFYDAYLEKPVFDEKFSKEVISDALNRFLEKFDIADDSAVWFEKVKQITTDMGFTTDMKAYKADPSAFPGTVADVSTMIRQAVTGKTNSPDLYTVMQILGYARTTARIKAVLAMLA